MSDVIKTIRIGKLIGKIYSDDSSENPRDFQARFSTMYYIGNRYTLGDKQVNGSELYRLLVDHNNVVVQSYLYDHSVQIIKASVSGNPFINPVTLNPHGQIQRNGYYQHAEWDSACCGVIVATKDAIRTAYGVKRITKKLTAQVQERLIGEVETFCRYINGDVYGYEIDNENGENIDSCWGFYGEDGEIEMIAAMRANGAEGEPEKFDGDMTFENEDIEDAVEA